MNENEISNQSIERQEERKIFLAENLKSKFPIWKRMTVEIVEMIYEAREIYSNQGKRLDLSEKSTSCQNGIRLNTFDEFIDYIGIPKRTAYNWLERYIPQENRLLESDELKELKQAKKIEKQKTNNILTIKPENVSVSNDNIEIAEKDNNQIDFFDAIPESKKSEVENIQQFEKAIPNIESPIESKLKMNWLEKIDEQLEVAKNSNPYPITHEEKINNMTHIQKDEIMNALNSNQYINPQNVTPNYMIPNEIKTILNSVNALLNDTELISEKINIINQIIPQILDTRDALFAQWNAKFPNFQPDIQIERQATTQKPVYNYNNNVNNNNNNNIVSQPLPVPTQAIQNSIIVENQNNINPVLPTQPVEAIQQQPTYTPPTLQPEKNKYNNMSYTSISHGQQYMQQTTPQVVTPPVNEKPINNNNQPLTYRPQPMPDMSLFKPEQFDPAYKMTPNDDYPE